MNVGLYVRVWSLACHLNYSSTRR